MPLIVDSICFDELTADPVSPVNGQKWYNVTDGKLKVKKDGVVVEIKTDPPQDKLDATVAPTATDDSAAGYMVGSHWLDTTADLAYICLDSTATAAVWTEITAAGGGVTVSQATTTSSTTTTNATDVLVNSMTLTPGAGNYLVQFSSSWKNSSAQDQFISIYVNGAKVVASQRMMKMESSITDTEMVCSTHAYITGVGASDAIEIRWRTTGGIATMLERTLTAMKVN